MNVVFDIGNVLVQWEPRALYRKIFATEDEVEWFIANVCTHEWNLEQDRGRSFADAVKEASARFPEHADAIAAYDLRWHETVLGAIDGSVAILQELQARGTPLPSPTSTRTSSARRSPAFPSCGRSATSWCRATSG